ncbi:MAG TPA: hypothetical protein VL547_07520 [Dinghuibacter sp.]|jgi:hypothetical protein|uniref:hypothetical protein n=1 Tax=Dinghuibacter sp. TaxID=2024697 RepID=UPI002C9414BE|nr:hypothetical protein [Dinghuibacter sp.]HTJ11856.1 hypothetical protein [Dinghuibacter sp.]
MKKIPLLLLIAACNTKPQAIKTITKNGVTLQVKKDDKAVKGGYEAFLIRIDYPKGMAFTKAQRLDIDNGLQEQIALISSKDTLTAVFFQRIASIAANRAEYLAAFDKPGTNTETLQITDNLFGLGRQQLTW